MRICTGTPSKPAKPTLGSLLPGTVFTLGPANRSQQYYMRLYTDNFVNLSTGHVTPISAPKAEVIVYPDACLKPNGE